MIPQLVEIDAYDILSGTTKLVRAADGPEANAYGIGGFSWSPAILNRAVLTLEIISTDLTSKIQTGRASIRLSRAALRDLAPGQQIKWNGSAIRIYSCPSLAYERKITEFVGRITDNTFDTDTYELTLTAEVSTDYLEKPLLRLEMSGLGGINGVPEKIGTLRPAGFGVNENIPPVWLDESRWIGQIDGYGNTLQILAAMEGASLFGAAVNDYADYAALAAAIDSKAIKPGQWGTCVAQGLVAFGAPPAAPIGINAIFGYGTPGQLIARAATNHAQADAALIDTASLGALDSLVPYPIHYWTATQRSVDDLVQAIARAANATAVVNCQGKLQTVRNAASAAVATLDRSGAQIPRVIDWQSTTPISPFWQIKMRAERPANVLELSEVLYEDTINDRFAFLESETYRQGDVVTMPDKSRYLYINTTPHVGTGITPPNSTYWELMEDPMGWPDIADPDGTKPQDGATRNLNRGAWAAGVNYEVGDFFTYNGSSYSVITAHTSSAGAPPPNANVQLLASAGAKGDDGLPGQKGADGTTFYTWIAYADSSDGTVNFTTGGPSGRTFIGIATNKTSATEGTNPSEYTWSAYAGPPNFGLVSGTNALVAGSRVYKVSGGNGWNSQVVSSESYFGGAIITVKPEKANSDMFFGLNSDPFTNDSYDSLDYAWRIMSNQSVEVWVNGVGVQSWTNNFNLGDNFSIQYDGKKVRWIRSGPGFSTIFHERDAAAGQRLWFDSSMLQVDTTSPQFSVIAWSAVGAAGSDGATGPAGEAAIGASLSTTSRTVYAFASGVVKDYNGISTEFILKQGPNDVSGSFAISVVANPQNLSVGIANRTVTITGAGSAAGQFGNAAVINATLTLRATGTGSYAGRTFDLVFSLQKVTGGYEIVATLPTTQNFEGRQVYLTSDGKMYTYTGGAWVSTITSASTIADSQIGSLSAQKLVGTVSSSQLGVGVGGNRLIGATPATRPDMYMFLFDQQNTGSVYQQNATYGSPMLSPLPNGEYPSLTYTLPDYSGFAVHQTNTVRGANPDYFAFRYYRNMNGEWSTDYSCEDGKSYEFTMYTGSHRCTHDILLVAVKADGTWVAQGTIGAAGTNASETAGGTTLNQWKRLVSRLTIPPGAGSTRLIAWMRKFGTNAGNDSWVFMCYPQIAECSPNATEMVPYSPPPLSIVTAQSVYTRSLTAQNIAVDSLGSNEIAANAINAKQMVLKDFENLIVDGDLASNSLTAYSRNQNGVGGMTLNVGDGGPGTNWPSRYCLYFARNGNSANELTIVNGRSNWDSNDQNTGITINPGDEFAFEAICYATAGGRISFDFIMRNQSGNLEWLLAEATLNTAVSGGTLLYAYPGTNYTTVKGVFKYTGTSKARAWLRIWGPDTNTPNANAYIWNMKMRRRNNSQLIVDGEIFTNKLSSLSVTSDKLASGSVIAGKIAADAITAINIQAQTIVASKFVTDQGVDLASIVPGSLNWRVQASAGNYGPSVEIDTGVVAGTSGGKCTAASVVSFAGNVTRAFTGTAGTGSTAAVGWMRWYYSFNGGPWTDTDCRVEAISYNTFLSQYYEPGNVVVGTNNARMNQTSGVRSNFVCPGDGSIAFCMRVYSHSNNIGWNGTTVTLTNPWFNAMVTNWK